MIQYIKITVGVTRLNFQMFTS